MIYFHLTGKGRGKMVRSPWCKGEWGSNKTFSQVCTVKNRLRIGILWSCYTGFFVKNAGTLLNYVNNDEICAHMRQQSINSWSHFWMKQVSSVLSLRGCFCFRKKAEKRVRLQRSMTFLWVTYFTLDNCKKNYCLFSFNLESIKCIDLFFVKSNRYSK